MSPERLARGGTCSVHPRVHTRTPFPISLPTTTPLNLFNGTAPHQPHTLSSLHNTTHTYISTHPFPPAPAGALTPTSGLTLRSTSPIMTSNASPTFWLCRAEVSVKPHLKDSARARPWAVVTWRCSGRRSDLLPMIVKGISCVWEGACGLLLKVGGKVRRGRRRYAGLMMW